jgi:hypothetical protein
VTRYRFALPNGTSPRAARALRLAVVSVALGAITCCSSVAGADLTAYCQPEDPTVTPQSAAPGDVLQVETVGREGDVDCEPSMPDRARYEVSIASEEPDGDPDMDRYTTTLGSLDPESDGSARGTIRVPDDIPMGRAEVSLRLQGAKTICEIDPSVGCAQNPFAPIEIIE